MAAESLGIHAATSPEQLSWKAFTISKYVRRCIPHLALVLLSCLYIIGGGLVFLSIEYPHELSLRNSLRSEMHQSKQDILDALWSRRIGLLHLMQQEKIIFRAKQAHISSIEDLANPYQNMTWTVSRAIFFAFTGLGDMWPSTFKGKLVFMFFSILGIPLVLLTIADIAHCVNCHLFIACLWLKPKATKASTLPTKLDPKLTPFMAAEEKEDNVSKEHMRAAALLVVAYLALGVPLFQLYLGSSCSYFDAFFAVFRALQTTGLANYTDSASASYLPLMMCYILFGVAILKSLCDAMGFTYILYAQRTLRQPGQESLADDFHKQTTASGADVDDSNTADLHCKQSLLCPEFGKFPAIIVRDSGANPTIFVTTPSSVLPKRQRSLSC